MQDYMTLVKVVEDLNRIAALPAGQAVEALADYIREQEIELAYIEREMRTEAERDLWDNVPV